MVPSVTESPALVLSDVVHAYDDSPVLNGASVFVEPGECVAVMGPSGCGKSTLLMAAAGILVPERGSITVRDQELSGMSRDARAAVRRTQIGLVFQFSELVSELSLVDNVSLACELAGTGRRAAKSKARALLDVVGLGEFADRFPGQVSGGQAQRAAIARAVVHSPGLVLADEPTGALDGANAVACLELLMKLAVDMGSGVLIATHDPVVAARCSRVVRMSDGRVVPGERPVIR